MALFGALAEATRRGEEMLAGNGAITASLAVTTPFKTVRSVTVNFNRSSAPGLGASTLTWAFASGVVTIYAWKPTGAGDTTLVAATVETTISYQIIGKRR